MTTTTPIMTASGSVQFRHYMVTVHAIERYIERIGGDVGNLILDLKNAWVFDASKKGTPRSLCASVARCGGEVMHKAFEIWVRQRYGIRYDLTRDCDGFYCREVVKRMFDVWRHCRGLDVV